MKLFERAKSTKKERKDPSSSSNSPQASTTPQNVPLPYSAITTRRPVPPPAPRMDAHAMPGSSLGYGSANANANAGVRPKTSRIMYRASTWAPVNIAVIKYWGKRDPQLNLPTNSSLSVTLSPYDLHAHTTAACSPHFQSDTLLLNNQPQDLSSPRTSACLRELRALRAHLERADPTLPPLSTYPLRLVSTNNFPTAAGLASSAAGFAALVRATADLFRLPSSPEELSRIARQGSGSACRSLMSGYVAWHAGTLTNGLDSHAAQAAPHSHWPTVRALILVASAAKKDVSSTAGMQATVASSALFPARANDIVPHRMAQIGAAIDERDFSSFGLLAMRDSNSFHATCADTWPPIYYMNEVSRAAVRFVEAVNAAAGEIVCAYSFDAGPNAVVFYEEANADVVLFCFGHVVGHVEGWPAVGAGAGGLAGSSGAGGPGRNLQMGQKPMGMGQLKADERVVELLRTGVSRVIATGVGEGPIAVSDHLVDEDGQVRKG